MVRKKDSIKYNDSWIYIMLLTTMVILIESLKTYTFPIGKVNLTYALFLLPLVYFINNYITKKKGFKTAVLAISISALGLVLFVISMNYITGWGFDVSNVVGDFCGYIVSQFVNLTIYQFLLDNVSPNFVLVFLTYMFSLIVHYLFYTLFYLDLLAGNNYWVGYFSTLLLQSVICVVITYVDMHVKRGL